MTAVDDATALRMLADWSTRKLGKQRMRQFIVTRHADRVIVLVRCGELYQYSSTRPNLGQATTHVLRAANAEDEYHSLTLIDEIVK
jgi:hypothetical protein